MRFKDLILIPLASLAFFLVFLSFRSTHSIHGADQEDRKKPAEAGKTSTDSKARLKDSLIGVRPYFLEMRGVVRQTQVDLNSTLKGQLLDSVEIKVFADSTRLVAVHYTSKHGECRFRLPLYRNLRLEISKSGFVSKLIDVNTKVPPERKMAYIFPFDIDLFESIPDLDVSALKHPIARVKFDNDKADFEYDEVFTNTVNRELKVLYKSYRDKMKQDGKK
jgi:hypothetical protein